MATEKRKERRIKVNLPIKITYPGHPEINAETGNISLLGAYIETDEQIPLGTDADIVLQIPSCAGAAGLSGEVRCKGNIFRCHPISRQGNGLAFHTAKAIRREPETAAHFGTGIFFTGFSRRAERDKLSRYINFLIEQEGRNLRAGIKNLKKIRKAKDKQPARVLLSQEDFQKETLGLLKQILACLGKSA